MSLPGPAGMAEKVDILTPASCIAELMEKLKCPCAKSE